MSETTPPTGLHLDDAVEGQAVAADGMNPAFEGPIGINLHFPDEPRERPGLLVMLHGWGGTYTQYDAFAEEFRNEYNVITLQVNYRNSGCGDTIYDFGKHQPIDVLRSLQYVRSHHEIDDERIIIWGGSGGGHVTLQTAKMAPTTFCLICEHAGITRPTNAWDKLHGYAADCPTVEAGWEERALGQANTYTPPEWRIRDAQYHASLFPSGAPIHIFHGDADEVVDVSHSLMMHRCLQAAGKRAELHISPGGNHANAGAPQDEDNRAKTTRKFADHDMRHARRAGPTDFDRRETRVIPVGDDLVYWLEYDKAGTPSLRGPRTATASQ
jgi:pimeloyl-ACP methyl ester carboxylesterase